MSEPTRIVVSPAGERRGMASDAERIDAACCRFEADWRAGGVPRIESYLAGANLRIRADLLKELLALELELRSESGEGPTARDYDDRFPDLHEFVGDVLAMLGRHAGPSSSIGAGQTARDPGSGPLSLQLRQIGDYQIVEELARGGMGVVYKARQLSLNRMVALKMILAGQYASEAEVRRFCAEAEAAARLDHPHIVPILEVGRHQGHAFFTMKLIEGNDLARQVGRFVGDPRRAATIMVAIAQAIHHAHRQGLIHRDLKPSNILIDPADRPHITDFGLVKRADAGASSLTASGAVLGTPSYMAPEQAEGGRVGPAADIYSIGAILYQLLTGRPPFRAATVAETLAQLIEHEPTPPRQLRPTIPRDLELICLKCLEKRPENRYASAAALAADLGRFLRGDGVRAGRSGPVRRLTRWARREPEFAGRLVTQSLILSLTQLNFVLHPAPSVRLHLGVSFLEGLWLASAILLRHFARKEQASDFVRMAWMLIDVALLTGILGMLRAVYSSLVLGYALVIAASGLWNRIRLVWFTTAISMLGYGILAFETWRREGPTDSNHYPNIILPALVVLGFLIGQQVRQIRALSPVDISTDRDAVGGDDAAGRRGKVVG